MTAYQDRRAITTAYLRNGFGEVIHEGSVKGEMVLLHGFVKKTQKTQPQDIDLAAKRRKEIM